MSSPIRTLLSYLGQVLEDKIEIPFCVPGKCSAGKITVNLFCERNTLEIVLHEQVVSKTLA